MQPRHLGPGSLQIQKQKQLQTQNKFIRICRLAVSQEELHCTLGTNLQGTGWDKIMRMCQKHQNHMSDSLSRVLFVPEGLTCIAAFAVR